MEFFSNNYENSSLKNKFDYESPLVSPLDENEFSRATASLFY